MNKSDLSLIKASVQKHIEAHFRKDPPYFIVGVSGGMDSMTLLHVLHQLEVPGLVSHINYGKRGEASDKDAELVRKMANHWGFEHSITKVDPADAEGENFQQWARNIRYQIFYQQADDRQADGIAVAHHQDDQLETILQKVFRGAGLESWGGMDVWERRLFRPLLSVSREQIEHYVQQHSVPYRTDASNLTSDFARNFLRNEWLKELEDFFPGWKQNVLRIQEQAQDFSHALAWISRRISDEWGIRRQEYHSLAPGLQKALVLHLLKKEQPGVQISHDSLERLDRLEELDTGKEIQLTDTLSLHCDRDHYVIKEHSSSTFSPVTVQQEKLQASPMVIGSLWLSIEEYEDPDFTEALYLDVDKLQWPLKLRLWHRGDQFIPFGMEGHQQVSDHLTNRKVSSAYKNQAKVIESFEETICAIIFPPIKKHKQPGTIAEPVKCGADTKNCLKIKYRS